MTSDRRGALGGVLAAGLVAVAAACGDNGTNPVVPEVIEDATFASQFVDVDDDTVDFDLGMMTELPEGVWVQDLVPGMGDTAVAGDHMHIHYNVWLRDGTLLGAGPFTFYYDSLQTAIEGMHIGTRSMQEEGTRFIVLPPAYAYGDAGNGAIYPGAIVVFKVQLDSITPP